jgi:excisionase family DNA binding protein
MTINRTDVPRKCGGKNAVFRRIQPISEIERHTPIEHLPQMLRVEEAAVWTDTSPWTIREAIRHGQLAHLRLGRLIRIPRDALVAMINGRNGHGK